MFCSQSSLDAESRSILQLIGFWPCDCTHVFTCNLAQLYIQLLLIFESVSFRDCVGSRFINRSLQAIGNGKILHSKLIAHNNYEHGDCANIWDYLGGGNCNVMKISDVWNRTQQVRQFRHNITLRRAYALIVAVEKRCVLHNLCVCL